MSDLFDIEIRTEHPKKDREIGNLQKLIQVRVFDMKVFIKISGETYDKILKNFDASLNVYCSYLHGDKYYAQVHRDVTIDDESIPEEKEIAAEDVICFYIMMASLRF